MPFSALDQLISQRYQPAEHPALSRQRAVWGRTRPLAGLRLLDATPLFFNTLVKYRSLLAAGAKLVIGVSDQVPRDPRALGFARERVGLPALGPDADLSGFDLVLDCGAVFAAARPRLGFVELTRSGVRRFAGRQDPVFVADGGRVKRVETALGTGESFFRAMASLGHAGWSGRSLVVFGSGKVGTGLIVRARALGAAVTVVTELDTVPGRLRQLDGIRWLDCRDRDAVDDALARAFAVVTATGVPGAVSAVADPAALARSPALLANMGLEDEYGPAIPVERVLNHKVPLNFTLEEPTLLRYIDATMALHNAGALWLLEHSSARGLIDPPGELEEELLEVSRRDGLLGSELDLI